MRKSIVLATTLALLLSGCSSAIPVPKVTPVALKYCALANDFNDDGLGRAAYIALQQLKIQTGATVQATEGDIEKLISGGCNLIITAGDQLVSKTIAAAKNDSSIKFVTVVDNTAMPFYASSPNPANLSILNFNISQSAYVAGYLAAAIVKENVVTVFDAIKSATSKKIITNFKLGVTRFNLTNRERVLVNQVLKLRGAELVFAIAGNSGEFVFADETNPSAAYAMPKVIGFNRDWAADARNVSFKPSIITSVIRIDAVGKIVAAALATESQNQIFDLTNGGVGLAPVGELGYPTGFERELRAIVDELKSGKIKVD